MRVTIVVAGLAILTTAALGQNAPSADAGKVVFDKWCTPCHGAVAPAQGSAADALVGPAQGFAAGALPGTSALRVKYNGELPAVLEERTDLVPEFIETVVRGGLFGMPITRKTEVSDSELEDIIAYLTRSNN